MLAACVAFHPALLACTVDDAIARINTVRRCRGSASVPARRGRTRSSAHLACILLLALTGCEPSSPPAYDAAACVGAPLRAAAAREHALEAGYEIIRRYDCIDRNSFDGMQRAKAADAASKRQVAATPASAPGTKPAQTLREARRGFITALAQAPAHAPPLPHPPAALFVAIHYHAARNPAAPAFITPDPQDGRKHPRSSGWPELTAARSSISGCRAPSPMTNRRGRSARWD